jgi:outer membrane protein OmpU
MKKVLLGSSVLLAAGVVTTPVFAADGIKLSLGGFFRTAVDVNIDDHSAGDLGNKRYNDGVFSDAEVYFVGKTKLDNGLTVGARVELEGEDSSDQIDAAYVYFQGGFGETRIGSLKGAMSQLCVSPVGGTTNFSAFMTSDQTITNAYNGSVRTDTVCNSVDAWISGQTDKSQKIVYITPNFGGFQMGVSWSPNGAHESAGVTGGHAGMPAVVNGEQRNILDAYAVFKKDFDGWGLQWGGGGSWALSMGGTPSATQKKGEDYQTGLNLSFGNLSVGGTFGYDKNSFGDDRDYWFAGAGAAYKIDAFTVGLQYAYTTGEIAGPNIDRRINAVALNGNYAMGPGISLDGTVQYTWADGDKGDAAHGGYDSISFGLGTAFTF